MSPTTILITGITLLYFVYVITNIHFPKTIAKQIEQNSNIDTQNDEINRVITYYSILTELYYIHTLRKRHLFVACMYVALNIGTVMWLYIHAAFPITLQVLCSMVIAAMIVTCNNIRLQNKKISTAVDQ